MSDCFSLSTFVSSNKERKAARGYMARAFHRSKDAYWTNLGRFTLQRTNQYWRLSQSSKNIKSKLYKKIDPSKKLNKKLAFKYISTFFDSTEISFGQASRKHLLGAGNFPLIQRHLAFSAYFYRPLPTSQRKIQRKTFSCEFQLVLVGEAASSVVCPMNEL